MHTTQAEIAALLAGGGADESQARALEDQHLAAKDYTTEEVCDTPSTLYYTILHIACMCTVCTHDITYVYMLIQRSLLYMVPVVLPMNFTIAHTICNSAYCKCMLTALELRYYISNTLCCTAAVLLTANSNLRLFEHNAVYCMPCTQVAARQAELQRMRALLFYHERKRHHINKIKSKMYHKVCVIFKTYAVYNVSVITARHLHRCIV
jgi:Utp14 protein